MFMVVLFLVVATIKDLTIHVLVIKVVLARVVVTVAITNIVESSIRVLADGCQVFSRSCYVGEGIRVRHVRLVSSLSCV